jgi:RimJ/RimL family protein N-acetyltransferase
MICESTRLVVRRWDLDRDLSGAHEMLGDEDYVRFIGGTWFEHVDGTREHLLHRARRYRGPRSLGFWAVEERASGEFVGIAVLDPTPGPGGRLTEDVQVGWLLRRAWWGRGLAQELGRTLLAHGHETVGLSRIICIMERDNTRSHGVARGIGLAYMGPTRDYYDLELDLYESRKGAERG